jgi:hypothetical protein
MIIEPNNTKDGFNIPSEYNKAVLKDWLKKYKAFDLEPRIEESTNSRRYLEGAVVPAYCHWQYGIDPRDTGKDEQRRYLFKKDFHYDIVEDRNGNPTKAPKSSKGEAVHILDVYTRYAEENGAPIPNNALYKLWRDKWATDHRFYTFFDFLTFLDIECDAMPSDQTLDRLGTVKQIAYPDQSSETAF